MTLRVYFCLENCYLSWKLKRNIADYVRMPGHGNIPSDYQFLCKTPAGLCFFVVIVIITIVNLTFIVVARIICIFKKRIFLLLNKQKKKFK